MNRRTVFIVSAFIVGFVAGGLVFGKKGEKTESQPSSFVLDFDQKTLPEQGARTHVKLTVFRVYEGDDIVYNRLIGEQANTLPTWRIESGSRVYLAAQER